MTPADVAALLAPLLREALSRSKGDILAALSPVQRTAAKLLWGVVLNRGATIAARVIVEAVIVQYQKLVPADARDALADILRFGLADPKLAGTCRVLLVLNAPTTTFLPVSHECVDVQNWDRS